MKRGMQIILTIVLMLGVTGGTLTLTGCSTSPLAAAIQRPPATTLASASTGTQNPVAISSDLLTPVPVSTAATASPSALNPAASQRTATPTLNSPSPAALTGAEQVPALNSKQVGDLKVSLLTTPNPPIRGSGTLKALITDTKGQPISDATLSFDISMTNMNMGKNVVAASSLGEGHYSGQVYFSMTGPWRVVVGINRAGQTNTIPFDFTVN